VNDLELQVADLQFSFPHKNLRFEVLNAHGGAVMGRQFFDEIQFSFMEGDQRLGFGEAANSLHVIRMAVGQENEINVLRVMESLER